MQRAPLETPFSDLKQIVSKAWMNWFHLVGRSGYVDRGDPSSYDYTAASFTKDAAWHDLDLSGIIGTGEKLVHFKYGLQGSSVPLGLYLRKNGNANAHNSLYVLNQVADVAFYGEGFVQTTAAGVIEYSATNSANWTTLNLVVRGWFI